MRRQIPSLILVSESWIFLVIFFGIPFSSLSRRRMDKEKLMYDASKNWVGGGDATPGDFKPHDEVRGVDHRSSLLLGTGNAALLR